MYCFNFFFYNVNIVINYWRTKDEINNKEKMIERWEKREREMRELCSFLLISADQPNKLTMKSTYIGNKERGLVVVIFT